MTMERVFGAQSTADDVLDGVDLNGRRVFITGVSAGIGAETARVLSAHGAQVIGAARDLDKAKAATAGSCSLIALELGAFSSVRACASRVAGEGPLDLIIANAGVMGPPFGRTAEGFEIQFGTNHLGHFLLVNLLAPLLPPGGRAVMLSSSAHHIADVDLDDPNFERSEYSPYVGYGRSKTANILFAVEFDRRHRASGIRAVAVHPGGVQTELGRHMDPATREAQRKRLEATAGAGNWSFFRKTVDQGAATTVWAGIVAPSDAVGGRYCEDCHVADVVPPGVAAGPMGPGVAAYAIDAARAAALWKKSEEMVGEAF
jgi:NAD(P)-dependent dehydrogenase (short-subunit alcohol dehydrogenase family)